ncbi:hypothetical protein GCM10023196_063180 [Actinoallomurus vinaceus]|uniref:Uncharacterized protein n=1 Tax=Actinoallomurus vinaceus TaxID=1080074 RepID=A0ABP8UK47_9ACTN
MTVRRVCFNAAACAGVGTSFTCVTTFTVRDYTIALRNCAVEFITLHGTKIKMRFLPGLKAQGSSQEHAEFVAPGRVGSYGRARRTGDPPVVTEGLVVPGGLVPEGRP